MDLCWAGLPRSTTSVAPKLQSHSSKLVSNDRDESALAELLGSN